MDYSRPIYSANPRLSFISTEPAWEGISQDYELFLHESWSYLTCVAYLWVAEEEKVQREELPRQRFAVGAILELIEETFVLVETHLDEIDISQARARFQERRAN